MNQESSSNLSAEPNLQGILKFLHYRDPQNENEATARAFLRFLVLRKDALARGGDNILNELYEKFKAEQ